MDINLNIKEKMSDKSLNNFKENDKTLYQQYIQDKNIDKNNIKDYHNKTCSNRPKFKKYFTSSINNVSEHLNRKIVFDKSNKFNNILPIIKEKEPEKKINNYDSNKEIIQKSSYTHNNLNIKGEKERPIKLRRELFNKLTEKNLINKSPKKSDSNNKFKSILFFEQYFGGRRKFKTKNYSFNEKNLEKEKFKDKLQNLNLPFFNDKIIFAKGETEKLLNYQFYKSSYKACCEIKKQNSMDNNCVKTNYNNNWNLVRQYTHDKRILNLTKQEKIMNQTKN